MKTVLQVLFTGNFSGAEKVVVSIIHGFSQFQPNEYRFIYTAPSGVNREILVAQGIEFAPMKRFSPIELMRVIREQKPDIIHAHDFAASFFCVLVSGSIPVISHLHNNPIWFRKKNPISIAYKISCRKYKRILGVSPAVFNEFIYADILKGKGRIIGNPIDNADIRRKSAAADVRQKCDILFLGRLTTPKDPLRFLRCMQSVCQSRPETIAFMVGNGELRDKVEKQISVMNLKRNIYCLGFLSNPYGVLANAKLLCMTSAWEGFGLVVVEALALGKPVVSTPVGGIPTIITGDEGALCQTDEQITEEILRLLDDDSYYNQKAEAALGRADELDNLEQYIVRIAQEYQNVLK